MIVSTTPEVSGYKIVRYLGVVHLSEARAAGIIKDIFARFNDFFGSKSSGYTSSLENLKQNLLNRIEVIAKEKGANAIVGLRLDIDNISAGKASLFICNLYGTAVVLKENKDMRVGISSTKTKDRSEQEEIDILGEFQK